MAENTAGPGGPGGAFLFGDALAIFISIGDNRGSTIHTEARMSYRYETHLHTCQASACGVSTGAEQARFYRAMGYTGIFITDHFFGGNCAIDRSLPWRERVGLFCAGYEDALAEGRRIGLDVFFAWEQNYEGDEYLIYGPDMEWLLAHPEIEHCTRREQLALVHEAGGAVIQAHPFRDRKYIKYILLAPDYCDGVEAVNTCNQPYSDVCAVRLAREMDLLVTAGSDNHNCAQFAPERLSGVLLDERLTCAGDYARLILSRGAIRPIIPEGWLDVDPDAAPRLSTFWVREDDPQMRRVPTNRDWMHAR